MKWVLKHQTATLLVTFGTLVLTLALYVIVPKGFFPVQDTGVILGVSEAPDSVSFDAMAERQQELAKIILQDKDVDSLSSFIGVDGTNTTPNAGPHPDQSEAARRARRRRIGDHPATAAGTGEGGWHHALHAAGAGSDGGRPREPHAVPVLD